MCPINNNHGANRRNSRTQGHSSDRDIIPGEWQVPLWLPGKAHTSEGRRVHESPRSDNRIASGIKMEASIPHFPRMRTEHTHLRTAEKDDGDNSPSQVPSKWTSHSFRHLRDVHLIGHGICLHRYALDTDFSNIPFSLHLESVSQVTDISFHPNLPNAHFQISFRQ